MYVEDSRIHEVFWFVIHKIYGLLWLIYYESWVVISMTPISERMVSVPTDQLTEEILPMMIKDVYQKNNLKCFVELVSQFPQLMVSTVCRRSIFSWHSISRTWKFIYFKFQVPDQQLISTEEQTKFLFNYGLQSNFCGENPTAVIKSLILCRDSYYRPGQ